MRLESVPPWAIYAGFAVLIVAATAPVWRLLVFGLSLDDWLQLRCF